jgi:hypothetical protein
MGTTLQVREIRFVSNNELMFFIDNKEDLKSDPTAPAVCSVSTRVSLKHEPSKTLGDLCAAALDLAKTALK